MIAVRTATNAVALAIALTACLIGTVASAHKHDHHHDHDGGNAFNWGTWNDGKQSPQEAFKNCFCWNTTSDNWCHNQYDGSNTGFWRESCQRVIVFNYWWIVLVVLWVMWLVAFPVFFCMFRMCCNCCGGRTPSFGCCCPISNRILSPDPKFVRPYSRCATWFAKSLALVVFITMLNSSIQGFVMNHQVSNSAQSTTNGVQAAVGSLAEPLDTLVGPTYAAFTNQTWWKIELSNIESKIHDYLHRLHQIDDTCGKALHDEHEARASPTYRIIAIPLALVVIVTILALCNVRSWPISIASGLISFLGAVLVILASVTISLSLATGVVCDNVDVVENFTQQILMGRGCGLQDVTNDINNTQFAIAKFMCSEYNVQSFLVAGTWTAKSLCNPSVGGMLVANPPAAVSQWGGLHSAVNGMYGATIVNTPQFQGIFSDMTIAATSTNKTLMACFDAGAAGCSDYNDVAPLVTFWNTYASLVLGGAVQTVFADNYKCNVIPRVIAENVLPALCGAGDASFKHSLNNVLQRLSGVLMGLGGICTFAVFVYINGAKRFTKSATRDELLAHHQQYQMQTLPGNQAPVYQAMSAGGVEEQKYAAPVPAAQPVVYTNTTSAVAGTTAQPLLLSHTAPNYNGSAQGSINNKEQPPLPM